MAQVVSETTRLTLDDVEIDYFEEDDLEKMASILYEAFPKEVWAIVEPVETRPPHEERMKRGAMRLRPLINEPCAHGLKAVHKPTGTIIGLALWHEPGKDGQYPTSYPAIPDTVFPSCFTPNFNRDTRDVGVALGWDKKEGWSSEDLDRMWSNTSPKWGALFQNYDKLRVDEMGERPHWLLGPVAVSPAYGRRGVGSLLVKWGQEKAREQKLKAERGELEARFKDVCCYLEVSSEARYVYAGLGFQGRDDPAKKDIMTWSP